MLRLVTDDVQRIKIQRYRKLWGKDYADNGCKNKKVAKDGKMKAVVSITFDDEFVVHDIKVIEGEKGLFIAMPSRKALDGEYRDIAHPINSATRDRIQQTILEAYGKIAETPQE